MRATLQAPQVHLWVDRLSPAQVRHLQDIVKNDDVLPDFADDPYGPVDQPVPASLLALIGSIDDPEVPTDYAENSDVYAHEAAMRRHAQSA